MPTRQDLAAEVGRMISQDRNITHGDPHKQFLLAQMLRHTFATYSVNDENIASTEAEALNMIFGKIARIGCGKNAVDHWMDIAGYALIGAEAATMIEEEAKISERVKPRFVNCTDEV